MPKDAHGNILQVGDEVLIRAKLKEARQDGMLTMQVVGDN